MKRQAQEQQQQASSEAQVKLSAAQAIRDKLQAQVDKVQESNASLHKQLADAHGKVCVCLHTAWADALVHGLMLRCMVVEQRGSRGCGICQEAYRFGIGSVLPPTAVPRLHFIASGALRCHH